jgi:diguanylate cyclase (GGDEF)-like protein
MKKIMIVDDEQISLMMTNHILSTEYDTICVASGQEAIDLYPVEQPDMILSNLQMPQMSGYELQQKLQSLQSRRIPFLFMTTDHDEEMAGNGLDNNENDFISKPFRADILLKQVGNILQTVEHMKSPQSVTETDPMTGLLSKSSIREEIEKICGDTSGALLLIDIDNFNSVNDIYGHDMGDKILIRFAEIIQSAIRSSDLAGRIGGDEFIAYCQNVHDESVIAEKTSYINKELLTSAKEYMGYSMAIPLGVSIGCAFSPESGTAFETLYQKADKALCTVKQNGKHGCSCYHEQFISKAEAPKSPTHLINAFQLLRERNPQNGALLLSFEDFRNIYHFLRRISLNYPDYQKQIWLLLLTLHADARGNLPEEIVKQFEVHLQSSLRKSDVIAPYSDNQFMVLIFSPTKPGVNTAVNRVAQRWNADDNCAKYLITCELDIIQ